MHACTHTHTHTHTQTYTHMYFMDITTNQDNWPMYNYTRLTTLAMFTDLKPELLCHAHSLGVTKHSIIVQVCLH